MLNFNHLKSEQLLNLLIIIRHIIIFNKISLEKYFIQIIKSNLILTELLN